MKYQDTWINGKLVEKGIRECQLRYDIISKFCADNLKSGFSVCDIGSNMAYFSIRLIEEFKAKSIAFEFHQYKERNKIISSNKTNNLMYINRKLKLNDLKIMQGLIKFDLILGLSVLHHVKEPLHEWITSMRLISKYTIVEIAKDDSKRTLNKNGYYLPNDYVILGYGESHLKTNFKREILLFKND